MDFSLRSRVEEKMDNPNMAFEMLEEAYEDINKCNKLLGGDKITINAVWNLIKRANKKSYTILDMGSGDGTMLRKLSKFLTNKNIEHQMLGIDLRDDVLAIARKRSKDYPQITFKNMDILKADSSFESDIIINTLTMHHFEEERLQMFLSQFVKLAKIGVVINDLQRSKWAYHLFKVFSFFFIQTDVAKYDGLVSISKGFTKNELVRLSEKIPNVIHTIRWKWAFRYVWIMQIKQENSI